MAKDKGSKAADQLRQGWRRRSDAAEAGGAAGPDRATFHLTAGLLEEMRDTVVALSGPPHRLTMSKLAQSALRRELDRLRKERGGLEHGKAFDHRAEQVTRGRPIR